MYNFPAIVVPFSFPLNSFSSTFLFSSFFPTFSLFFAPRPIAATVNFDSRPCEKKYCFRELSPTFGSAFQNFPHALSSLNLRFRKF